MDIKDQQPKPQSVSEQPQPSMRKLDLSLEDLDGATPRSTRKGRKWLKLLLGIGIPVIVLAAIVFGVYWWLYGSQDPTPTPPTIGGLTSTQQTPAPAGFKRYDSKNFSLRIDHPENWALQDAGKNLTITSPTVSLADASGQNQSARIVMIVQPKGTVPSALENNKAVAVLPSSKLIYVNPSRVQRGQTYVSYLQYPGATVKGTLDGVYVTGDFGYQKDQYITKSNLKQLQPLIHVMFEKCLAAKCTSPQPLSISSASWQDSRQQDTVQKILESIRVDTGSKSKS